MYSKETNNISVSVEPFYVAEMSEPEAGKFVFGYTITLVNNGVDNVQLISRHWQIVDGVGRKTEVRGEGVVGEQPILRTGEPYTYTSGTPLPTPSGMMGGTYQMRNNEGMWFDIEIPFFSLDAPFVDQSKH